MTSIPPSSPKPQAPGLVELRLGHAPNCSALGNVLNVLAWSQAAVGALWVAATAWEARRRRPEPDGGETRLVDEPPALVRTGDGGGPLEVHVQVTRACGLPCPSCHVPGSASLPAVPLPTLRARFRELAERGVMRVALGGGEPTRHPELPAVIAAAKEAGLAVGLTTAGLGVEPERVAGADQVNVSLDGLGEAYRRARGYAGDDAALATVRRLAAAGRRVGVNVVLTRETWAGLDDTVAAAIDAGASDVQLLRLKPRGRGVADYLDRRLSPGQALALWPRVRGWIDRWPAVSFRFDCALLPFLAAHDPDPERLRAFAIWGCHGGDHLASLDTEGATHPCSFADGPADARWREGVRAGPCATCPYQPSCRGGCHAVAAALTGDPFAPDPECPRTA